MNRNFYRPEGPYNLRMRDGQRVAGNRFPSFSSTPQNGGEPGSFPTDTSRPPPLYRGRNPSRGQRLVNRFPITRLPQHSATDDLVLGPRVTFSQVQPGVAQSATVSFGPSPERPWHTADLSQASDFDELGSTHIAQSPESNDLSRSPPPINQQANVSRPNLDDYNIPPSVDVSSQVGSGRDGLGVSRAQPVDSNQSYQEMVDDMDALERAEKWADITSDDPYTGGVPTVAVSSVVSAVTSYPATWFNVTGDPAARSSSGIETSTRTTFSGNGRPNPAVGLNPGPEYLPPSRPPTSGAGGQSPLVMTTAQSQTEKFGFWTEGFNFNYQPASINPISTFNPYTHVTTSDVSISRTTSNVTSHSVASTVSVSSHMPIVTSVWSASTTCVYTAVQSVPSRSEAVRLKTGTGGIIPYSSNHPVVSSQSYALPPPSSNWNRHPPRSITTLSGQAYSVPSHYPQTSTVFVSAPSVPSGGTFQAFEPFHSVGASVASSDSHVLPVSSESQFSAARASRWAADFASGQDPSVSSTSVEVQPETRVLSPRPSEDQLLRSQEFKAMADLVAQMKIGYKQMSDQIKADGEAQRERKRQHMERRRRRQLQGRRGSYASTGNSSSDMTSDTYDSDSSAVSEGSIQARASPSGHVGSVTTGGLNTPSSGRLPPDSGRQDRGRSRRRQEHHRSADLSHTQRDYLRRAGFTSRDFRAREEQSSFTAGVHPLPAMPSSQFVINMSTDSLGVFSGEIEDYIEFRGEFMSLASVLPSSSRLSILKQKVKGSRAEHVISRFSGTKDAAFDAALRALDREYDRPEELVQLLLFQIQSLFEDGCKDDDDKFATLVAEVKVKFHRIFEISPDQALAANGMLPSFISCMPGKLFHKVSSKRFYNPGWYNFANVLKEAEKFIKLLESQKSLPERKSKVEESRFNSKGRSYSPYNKSNRSHSPYSKSSSPYSKSSRPYSSFDRSKSSYSKATVQEVKVSPSEETVEVELQPDIKEIVVHEVKSYLDRFGPSKAVTSASVDKSSSPSTGRERSRSRSRAGVVDRSKSRGRSSSRPRSGYSGTLNRCNLCHTDDHSGKDCQVDFTKDQLVGLTRERWLCYLCLQPGHRAYECPLKEWCPEALCHREQCSSVPHCSKLCTMLPNIKSD